jgi:dihydrofolate reductase
MLIGGAELYKTSIDHADKLYVTRVDADIEGDAFFPEIDASQWQEMAREAFKANDSALKTNPYDYAFTVLTKRS